MRSVILLLLTLTFSSLPINSQSLSALPKTQIVSASERNQLLGKHKFQLHWISWNRWKDFADLTVIERQGKLVIKGRQQKGKDYLEIDGVASHIEDKQFTFQGEIVTRVSYKNNGNPCRRDGIMTFKITGKRRYWRLQEMQSPCDETTDYVDIFLR
ncbi:MAG: hypothetical protein ACR2IB_08560 [Pyrinomonadaceae bacterium]